MIFAMASGAVYQFLQAIGIPGVLTLVLGGPAIGALVTWLLGRHKPKIEKKDAELATAEKTQGMSLALATRLEGEISRISGELKTVREDLKTETGEREKLAEKVRIQSGTIFSLRVYISRVADWWAHLVENWDELRLRPAPPALPQYTEQEGP